MARRLIIALALVAIAPTALAQGIRGVTRRTTTLERQQPARQFFQGAGIQVNGANPIPGTAAAAPTTLPPRQPTALVHRPPPPLPPIYDRIARPQVVQTRPAGIPTTPRVPKPIPVPAQSHAKP